MYLLRAHSVQSWVFLVWRLTVPRELRTSWFSSTRCCEFSFLFFFSFWNRSKITLCSYVFSHLVVSDSVTQWTVACQAPLSMRFSRQEIWSGLPYPSSGDLGNRTCVSCVSCIEYVFFTRWTTGKALQVPLRACAPSGYRAHILDNKQSLYPYCIMLYITQEYKLL